MNDMKIELEEAKKNSKHSASINYHKNINSLKNKIEQSSRKRFSF